MAIRDVHSPSRFSSASAGQGRSTPTGYAQEEGDVRAQELQFDNGYKVLAIQVLGQKAFIKGAGPWRDFIDRSGSVVKLVKEWLHHVEGRHPELVADLPEEGEVELVAERRTSKVNLTPHRRRATDQPRWFEEKVELRPRVEGMPTPPPVEKPKAETKELYPRNARLETIVERLAVAVMDTQQEVSRLVRQVDSLISEPPQEIPPPTAEAKKPESENK